MCSTIIGWGGGYNLHLAAKRQECYNYVRMSKKDMRLPPRLPSVRNPFLASFILQPARNSNSWFVHLQATWLGNNVSCFVHLQAA
jgi:hypothetical protein